MALIVAGVSNVSLFIVLNKCFVVYEAPETDTDLRGGEGGVGGGGAAGARDLFVCFAFTVALLS